ncbi:hypothetical protein UT4_20650 [Ferrigenium sp. UT4]
MMIDMPTRATVAPTKSQTVGLTPSTAQSQRMVADDAQIAICLGGIHPVRIQVRLGARDEDIPRDQGSKIFTSFAVR